MVKDGNMKGLIDLCMFEKLLHEQVFNPEYCMSYSVFVTLCEFLDPLLHRQHAKSRNDEPITTTQIVAASLRILADGKQVDQKHIFGLSRAVVHHVLNCFVDAVSGTTED